MIQTKKNILFFTYWSYKDALIQTYTLPYVRIIRKIISDDSKIFLVTFENKFHSISSDETEQIKQQLACEKISWLSFSYSHIGVFSFLKNVSPILKLWWLCIAKKITRIHVWCTPAGSLGYVLSKLTGIPLIIDSYEPHAEAMVENGTWKKSSFAFKLLFYFEKKMSHYASVLIAASSEMGKYAEEKYNLKNKRIYVKPACVDLEKFSCKYIKDKKLLTELGLKNKIVCVYAGKFGGIYLEQEVFDFFKVAHKYWEEKFSVLLLTSISRKQIEHYAEQARLDKEIIISKFVEHKEIPIYLSLADFAINPVKPVPTKKYCTSIKDGEYWAMGLPVVITKDISDDSDIIRGNKIGTVIESLDEQGYLKAVKEIDILLKNSSCEDLYNKIRPIAEKYRNFSIAKNIYKGIYGEGCSSNLNLLIPAL